jgi:hypothetical protein
MRTIYATRISMRDATCKSNPKPTVADLLTVEGDNALPAMWYV